MAALFSDKMTFSESFLTWLCQINKQKFLTRLFTRGRLQSDRLRDRSGDVRYQGKKKF
jgi:hypothetical protein